MLTNNPAALAEATPTKNKMAQISVINVISQEKMIFLSAPPTSEYANPAFWRLASD